MKKTICWVTALSSLMVFTVSACKEEHMHTYRENIVFPTCITQGYTTFSCECGDSYVANQVEKTGHNYRKKIISEATCAHNGEIKFTCVDCGDSYTDEYEEEIAHEYGKEITNEATCMQTGIIKFSCKNCNDEYTESYSLSELSAEEIFEQSKNAVGEITTYDKDGASLALGTGFIYSHDGKIITNYHVIENAYSAKITINNMTYKIQTILAYDKEIDLAVLKIEARDLPVVDICTREHGVGKAVYAFGSSKGLTATFSQGIITYADREIDGVHYVQHDAAISNGNSGGPLINSFGEIIGINTMTIRDSQNLNFAISVKELSNLSYEEPLTFAQFYEKECDVFVKIKNYIIKNGEYDATDKEYALRFNSQYIGSDVIYITIGYYSVEDDEVQLALYMDIGGEGQMIFMYIDEVDGVYDWVWLDDDYYMEGSITASTWTGDSLLGIEYYTVPVSALTSARELASLEISLLLANIEDDYSDIGITEVDFGFVSF